MKKEWSIIRQRKNTLLFRRQKVERLLKTFKTSLSLLNRKKQKHTRQNVTAIKNHIVNYGRKILTYK